MKLFPACSPRRTALLLFFLVSNFALLASAQPAADHQTKALTSWISLDAPPGWEHLATDVLLKAMPGWQRDALGNLILRKGSGTPRRVIACALDRPSFAVTEMTDSGYLRLREAGSLRVHPLWAQFHEGQRIKVLTRNGMVPGVVIVKSTHLQRGRASNSVTSLDELWVDVGASSRAEVRGLGIQPLDPVVRDMPEWSYGEYVAGPGAAWRAGCAAVAQVATGSVTTQGETFFLLTTLRSFGNDGMEAGLRKLGKIDELTLIERSAESASADASAVLKSRVDKPAYVPDSAGISTMQMVLPRTRYYGSLVESVSLSDLDVLRREIEQAAGVTPSQSPAEWITLPKSARTSTVTDRYSTTANLLKTLADVPGVSGHEAEVRAEIISSLPSWARRRAVTDPEGNLVVEIGPDNDPVMFIAHQDEVGFEITAIADDGSVSLRNRGGLYPSLWEGQPALLHFDRLGDQGRPHRALNGVFVPRDTATSKQPENLTAWFGMNALELKRLGVKVGLSVTGYKSATRLAGSRFTSRALDDRAGSTALILAAVGTNPAALDHKVIFAWSVSEETGLQGAIALAKRYGSKVKRVFSVDTFVSSDSPIENTRFAFAPLGHGAVIRGLDNSSVAAPAEIDRIMKVARLQRLPLQVGATNGGTDGSDFVRYGAIHVSLSWPGRYSHSPVEVLDLKDLEALAALIKALALSR